MDKRIFDFSDELGLQALAPGQGTLTVLAGVDGFSLLATGAASSVLALRAWAFDYAGSSHRADTEMDLRRIFGSEPIFSRRFAALRCALSDPGVTLVPRRLFRAGDELGSYFRLLLPAGEYAYGYEELPECDVVLVWAVDPVLPRLCKHYFPEAPCTHLAAPLLRAFQQQAPPDGAQVMMNLRHQVAQIAVFERRNLLFYNSFYFRHANDLLYYTLLAYEQCRLHPAETPLMLAGSLLEDSDAYRQLYRYVRHLRFAALPGHNTLPEGARSLPAHCHVDLFCI